MALRFEPIEIETLVAVVADVRTVIEAGQADDPVSRRLFPRAYLDPTEETAQGASNIRGAAGELSRQADELMALVGQFEV